MNRLAVDVERGNARGRERDYFFARRFLKESQQSAFTRARSTGQKKARPRFFEQIEGIFKIMIERQRSLFDGHFFGILFKEK
jgi:hypothetical protein